MHYPKKVTRIEAGFINSETVLVTGHRNNVFTNDFEFARHFVCVARDIKYEIIHIEFVAFRTVPPNVTHANKYAAAALASAVTGAQHAFVNTVFSLVLGYRKRSESR